MLTYEAWVTNARPIYARLPRVKYYIENPENPSNWLTRWFDELLIKTKATIDDLPRQLNAATCDADWLDFVAALSGFTGEYWEKAWPVAAKRIIAQNADRIWSNKGTKDILELILSAFNLQAEVYVTGGFYAGVTQLPGLLGSPTYQYFIYVPIVYLRTGREFRLIQKINRLFGPVFCESRVAYKGWFAGVSVAGDPVY
jgi:hypothetical protein